MGFQKYNNFFVSFEQYSYGQCFEILINKNYKRKPIAICLEKQWGAFNTRWLNWFWMKSYIILIFDVYSFYQKNEITFIWGQ